MPNSKLTQVALGSLLIMAFFSCKTTGLDSRQRGHYENFSEADLLPYKGKVRVIPEHNDSAGVIMAVEAVDGFKLYPLLRAFQTHPAKPTVYMPMLTSNYSNAPQELQEFLNDGQFKLFSIPESPSRIQDDIAWTRDWAPWTASFKPNPNAATEARFTDFNY